MAETRFTFTSNWHDAIVSDEIARRWGQTHNFDYELTGVEPVTELTIISGADLPPEITENIPGGAHMVNKEYYYIVVETPNNKYPYRLVRACASEKQRRRAEADRRRAQRYGWINNEI